MRIRFVLVSVFTAVAEAAMSPWWQGRGYGPVCPSVGALTFVCCGLIMYNVDQVAS